MTTATARGDQAIAATMPLALFGLAEHMLEHMLDAPLDVEVPGHADTAISLYVAAEQALAWTRTAITVTRTEDLDTDLGVRHVVSGVLDTSCLRVRILWTTPAVVDHETCRGGCGEVLCYCRGSKTQTCDGTIEPACHHGEYLCHADMTQCSECVDDLRQDRAQGWVR